MKTCLDRRAAGTRISPLCCLTLRFHQRFVQSLRLLGDRWPAKLFFGSFSTGFAKFLAELWIRHELINPRSKITRELVGIDRFKRALSHLLKRNQKTRHAIDHHFSDPADCAGYDGGFTSHGF